MPMECMDDVNLGNCLWFEGGIEKINVICGMISGLLVSNIILLEVKLLLIIVLQFAVGWWLIIDGMVVNPSQVPGTYHLCGLVGTLSLFM